MALPQKTSLAGQYPWTTTPLIINAPMGGFATHELAIEVSSAGGLGFIGPVMSGLTEELSKARDALKSATSLECKDVLPLGLGFILWAAELDEAAKIVEEYKPAALWLFAAPGGTAEYATWTEKLRDVSPKSKIWIQSGSVASAISLAKACKPDVLVMQGTDAGGHGPEKGAGIISLVPETIDALAESGFGDIFVVAAGGIVEGRGAAAALNLGAEGVVLGTRFLASKEVKLPHPIYTKALLEGKDGGQSTVRDKVFDQLRGSNRWPVDYDGRALVNRSYKDWKDGVGLEEIQRLNKEVEDTGMGFGEDGKSGRSALWVGTGIGLVTQVQSAREIVEEIREGATKTMEMARARI